MSVWGEQSTQFFYKLTPDEILTSVEKLGVETTGRVLTLNSMENRVYEVEVESDSDHPSDHFYVFKFYRPGRWSKEQILEEHEFLWDLKESEINVIAPLKFNGKTLFENDQGLYYCGFPKKGGRAIDEWNEHSIGLIGRMLARVHSVGKTKKASHRLTLDIQTFGKDNLTRLQEHIPSEYRQVYIQTCEMLFQLSAPLFEGITMHRIHGDCHHGNTIMNNEKPYLIDFDDMLTGPAIQDLWMIVPGIDEYSLDLRNKLLTAYEQMADFNNKELKLIEPLRALRMIHFSTWIAARYDDPAFQRTFSHFQSATYWEKELYDLKHQIQRIQDATAQFY